MQIEPMQGYREYAKKLRLEACHEKVVHILYRLKIFHIFLEKFDLNAN